MVLIGPPDVGAELGNVALQHAGHPSCEAGNLRYVDASILGKAVLILSSVMDMYC